MIILIVINLIFIALNIFNLCAKFYKLYEVNIIMNIETLRNKARKQGLFIRKSPDHVTGGYMIVDTNNTIQAGQYQGLSLDEIENILMNKF